MATGNVEALIVTLWNACGRPYDGLTNTPFGELFISYANNAMFDSESYLANVNLTL